MVGAAGEEPADFIDYPLGAPDDASGVPVRDDVQSDFKLIADLHARKGFRVDDDLAVFRKAPLGQLTVEVRERIGVFHRNERVFGVAAIDRERAAGEQRFDALHVVDTEHTLCELICVS